MTLSAVEIATERLLLRPHQESDRPGIVEIFTDPEVRTYLGGPRPLDDVTRMLDALGSAVIPGSYVIEAANEFAGTMALGRRDAAVPGHVVEGGSELELSYVLRRDAWGKGLAFEAATALLRTAAELPDQPVVLVTQSANTRSLKLAARLGFTKVDTFEQHEAEQTLAVAQLHEFK
ncbi:GNAT family N-acetyltransferase [Kibdelosporangium philippinense]|uniref:GNAT family N-acetyltransferase n=1 Tax=Kibdelosporangium philippinense TaxID=211113 RepID=A0ABS8ZE94_9PSEU|nr:GNAT family N-acetyltransferase [Kibdelosporangium philippinense]MCE7006110.1 GNAT family N-acetyltransferase [Kibdelosporangium philippinense]